MTGFDYGIIIFIVFSGLFAFVRGFIKEVLSIVAWFGASVAALYAYPYLRPLATRVMPNARMGDATAGLIAFVIALLVLSLATAVVAKRVKDSPAGGIDRTLGLIFGLGRGALLSCLIYIAMSAVLPALGAAPAWFTEARTRPLLQTGVDALLQLSPRAPHAPKGVNPSVERQFKDALHALTIPKSSAPPPNGAPDYPAQDQRDLNRLFQQNQGTH
jgi:membrane protein required for colicin V production